MTSTERADEIFLRLLPSYRSRPFADRRSEVAIIAAEIRQAEVEAGEAAVRIMKIVQEAITSCAVQREARTGFKDFMELLRISGQLEKVKAEQARAEAFEEAANIAAKHWRVDACPDGDCASVIVEEIRSRKKPNSSTENKI